jgi:pseudouridine-5'-phosphate glycosidase
MLRVSKEIQDALDSGRGVVGLESVVLSHGLPKAVGLKTAVEVRRTVRRLGAMPATCAILNGEARVGLSRRELAAFVHSPPQKVNPSSLPPVLSLKQSGACTASATMVLCHRVGIHVVTTGGIGGVHRGTSWDISSDLRFLGSLPLIVVCSGIKSILDVPRTVEILESLGVPVVGYKTSSLPGFYTQDMGISLSYIVDSPHQIAEMWAVKETLGIPAAILIMNPPPEDLAFPQEEVEKAVQTVLKETKKSDLHGPEVTPAQLGMLQQKLGPQSVELNRTLLVENSRLAAEIASVIGSRSPSNDECIED